MAWWSGVCRVTWFPVRQVTRLLTGRQEALVRVSSHMPHMSPREKDAVRLFNNALADGRTDGGGGGGELGWFREACLLMVVCVERKSGAFPFITTWIQTRGRAAGSHCWTRTSRDDG